MVMPTPMAMRVPMGTWYAHGSVHARMTGNCNTRSIVNGNVSANVHADANTHYLDMEITR